MTRFQFALCNLKWLLIEVRKSFAGTHLRWIEWELWNDPKARAKMMEEGIAIDLNAPHWKIG